MPLILLPAVHAKDTPVAMSQVHHSAEKSLCVTVSVSCIEISFHYILITQFPEPNVAVNCQRSEENQLRVDQNKAILSNMAVV